jgi:hypothetical protein
MNPKCQFEQVQNHCYQTESCVLRQERLTDKDEWVFMQVFFVDPVCAPLHSAPSKITNQQEISKLTTPFFESTLFRKTIT